MPCAELKLLISDIQNFLFNLKGGPSEILYGTLVLLWHIYRLWTTKSGLFIRCIENFCLWWCDLSSLWLAERLFTSFKDDYFSIKSVDNIVT